MKKLLISAFIASSLIGCTSVPMGDAKQDAALKVFKVPVDRSGIYIYRTGSLLGAMVKMDVMIDGTLIGQTASNTYLYKEVTPGKHTIVSKAENTDSIDIEAKPGTLNYVRQEVQMGIVYSRNKLHLVDEVTGKKGITETKLAETK